MEQATAAQNTVPAIKCSTCDVSVPLYQLADHVCAPVTTTEMFEEPAQIEPMYMQQPLRPQKASRPSLPKLDLFASTRLPSHHGELTPASSGPGSATASPLSSGLRSPFPHPSRKASMPVRRPPSPELLSQDCAFPPFPTNKSKKKDSTKNAKDRTRTGDSKSSRTFEQQRSRSASVGAPRSRSRHGTADSSRPSTANSSRQPSLSSRAGSRQGSIDVPPLPALQSMPSHTVSDPGAGITDAHTSYTSHTSNTSNTSGHTEYPATSALAMEVQASELATNHLHTPAPTAIPEPLPQPQNEITQQKEPLYKAKRPPPIIDMPLSILEQSQVPKSEPSPSAASFSQPPSNTITRTLTSLFGRKRNLSTSSKKGSSKAPATDGPRFMALSPDPDPQENLVVPSTHTSLIADMSITPPINGVHEGSCSPVDVHTVHHIPEPSKAEILQSDDASDYGDADEVEQQPQGPTVHDEHRDTLQMEQDLEKRLAAMGVVPRLSVVDETNEDIKRASVDSASSYGSVGFSHGSASSRSFQGFEGHSQGSSISTARTTSTTDELLLFPKPRSVDLVPDSPTDPYMQHVRLESVPEIVKPEESESTELDSYLQNSRLSTVHEVQSPEEEKSEHSALHERNATISSDSEPDSYGFPLPPRNRISIPNISSSHGERTLSPMSELRQRRPSTPGAFRGMCRGCSKVIVGGQKSVSSKDGQLTGRYHKECFTCMTCHEPFATADFYVHDDHPYCAYHYHEINNTLCEGCGKGIEGQYLETSNVTRTGAKKYHPSCLQCATCKTQLDEDYFELGGRVYCERDAFRVASGPRSPYGTMPSRPSPLNREYINSNEPGHAISAGRFPERRLTRLMTTN